MNDGNTRKRRRPRWHRVLTEKRERPRSGISLFGLVQDGRNETLSEKADDDGEHGDDDQMQNGRGVNDFELDEIDALRVKDGESAEKGGAAEDDEGVEQEVGHVNARRRRLAAQEAEVKDEGENEEEKSEIRKSGQRKTPKDPSPVQPGVGGTVSEFQEVEPVIFLHGAPPTHPQKRERGGNDEQKEVEAKENQASFGRNRGPLAA